MRLYLDQMLRADLAEQLRHEGHNVVRAEDTGQQRADDEQILATADADHRVLVTLDEDFGDWAVLRLRRNAGVIRLKAHPTTTNNIARLLLPLLAKHGQEEFRNHLVIASDNQTRWVRTSAD